MNITVVEVFQSFWRKLVLVVSVSQTAVASKAPSVRLSSYMYWLLDETHMHVLENMNKYYDPSVYIKDYSMESATGDGSHLNSNLMSRSRT